METRKTTTAGVLFWTPAPARTSSTSSVISEEVWEDEDEEQAEKDNDCVSHNNGNAITGLLEALKNMELGTSCADADAACNPVCYPGPLILEEEEPSGHERDISPEELSYSLSDDDMSSSKADTDGEEMERKKEQGTEHLSESERYLDMTEEKDVDKDMERTDSNRNKNLTSATEETRNDLAKSYRNREEKETIGSTPSCGACLPVIEPAQVSNQHCPVSQSATAIRAPAFPHLLHFTAEEMAGAPGIDAETLPEISFIDGFPESNSSQMSLKSSPRSQISARELDEIPAAAIFPEQVITNRHSGVTNVPSKQTVNSDKHCEPQPDSSLRKMRQPSPKATYSKSHSLNTVRADASKSRQSVAREPRTPRIRTKAAGVNESRNGCLSYQTPDFSKVEPRVRFPKACSTPPTSAPKSTVPQEFRCRQQAATLLNQLQEDYNRLLTKYAEAENTIDRLRLEAKVNMYSDPPKPSHSVQSGLSYDTSKFMTLDFSQAQRAEISSASPRPNGHSVPQSPRVGQQLDKILCDQADKFVQQLHIFEELLKREKLTPFEQMKCLSQLAEGLDSLERGYLLARDKHKHLKQQQKTEISHFDHERELEGLIYQCGLQMYELREQVEKKQQQQSICETPPSPRPRPTPSSVPSEVGETLIHPQSPPVPLVVDPGGGAEVEVSSASEESEKEEAEHEETLKSLYLRHSESDFGTLEDHYQSFKELPKTLDHSLREGALLSAALGRRDEEQGQGSGSIYVQKGFPESKVRSDAQDSPPVCSSKPETSRFNAASHKTTSQSTTVSFHPPTSCRGLEVGKSQSSSLSSLGEISASERKNSKPLTGSKRGLSQDGLISPVTDSGFVGSESSRLTPAAAPSPLHQRAPERVSVCQEGNVEKTQTGPVSAPSSASSPSYSHTAMEPEEATQLSSDQPKRTRLRQRRSTFSCSPQRWASHQHESSEFGLESDNSHATSEDRQSDQYADSINSLHSSYSSSSPTLRAVGFSQVANHNGAVQTLQAEVARLKGRLESCLRIKKPLSSVRAAPLAQENHTPHYTSAPFIRPGDRHHGDVSRGRRERRTVDEVDESAMRRTTRMRLASAQTQKAQPDILTSSKLDPSTPQVRPQMSRCTQTSAAAPDSHRSHTNTVQSRRTHPRQHPSTSFQVSETADEPGSRCQDPLCPQCLLHYRRRSEHRHRDSEPSPNTSCQPAESPDRAARSRYVAASPALMHYMPVCPPPLLLYPSPFYLSPSNNVATSSVVRRHRDLKERTMFPPSTDMQRSLDNSLDKAIRAARHMKHTSRHMAQSLSTGLQCQELLMQSCSY
ncbi:microtubule organization protein AKNA isoform X2 [Mastacembelus armatus]|uniref:microtubule organization protein AKNA isoform X2 n=1 Tax=Mastacembelus armatus TaxID=205130 RepID=UPI000E45D588|nr:microtubule organization protein AKNA isoform X2 [Mastacembelus armatus]